MHDHTSYEVKVMVVPVGVFSPATRLVSPQFSALILTRLEFFQRQRQHVKSGGGGGGGGLGVHAVYYIHSF